MWKFLGVLLVEALLEHLGLFEVGLLPGVLASGEEDLCMVDGLPRWKSSSKMEAMNLESTCWSAFCLLESARFMGYYSEGSIK
jgi:hypothetical protein